MVNSGVYVLWLYLPRRVSLTVGKLGTFSFPPGVYAYSGSAQRHLQQRIARHRRAAKKLHWHIDYFRAAAELLGFVVFPGAPKEGECRCAEQLLRLPGAALPAPGLGSSDCSCGSHLVYLPSLQPGLVALGHAVENIELGAAKPLAFFDAGD
ncbi:GIY-YIG nuclease family protein [Candidatus Darwinibacter acetoxidans]|jgi:Uri superfamily endonuclease|nr:GIY-YIG nuclease family protein [Limnochordia bacterium]MDI9465195.1 GIY-YIG nuclease family protein [Bacillota bacterium]NLO94687.1 GIY-YIG nuclease family protein [Bacillota bacterium]HOB39884.1 GIY-YIG nuclease family protein [Limnochordia bacterium]HOK31683.1 GIY-YIG nuclease family protein [Limnochordia bacterium]